MYPTDIYDWSNDPDDYDYGNNDFNNGDSNRGKHKNLNNNAGHLDNMKDPGQYGQLSCIEKTKIRKRHHKLI